MIQRAEAMQVKEVVYQSLKSAIVTMELAPGEPLTEAALSAELGVSKTPVREALVRLEYEGLVDIQPYRGAVVSGYSSQDLIEIYELREIFEGACARRAAMSISSEDLRALDDVIRRSDPALGSGNVPQLAQLFDQFDELIFRQFSNARLQTLLSNLQDHLVRIGAQTIRIPGRLERSVEQHAGIFAAVEERDGDGAERLMREHVRSVLADQLRSREAMENEATTSDATGQFDGNDLVMEDR